MNRQPNKFSAGFHFAAIEMVLALSTATIQSKCFVLFFQPLSLRRNTHERVRKELKERWAKACRKMVSQSFAKILRHFNLPNHSTQNMTHCKNGKHLLISEKTSDLNFHVNVIQASRVSASFVKRCALWDRK